MTSPLLPGNEPHAELSLLEDGARYALLQRLAPVLQHQIMGNFQSMDMIAVMMDRRLQSASPDLDSMRQDCALLGSVSESAIKSVINLLTWVRPKPSATQRFDAGVEECATLLLNEFKLKGFIIANEVSQVAAELSSRVLRSVVSAALVCLSDESTAPATLTLRAQAFPDRIDLSIDLSAQESQQARILHAQGYRLLNWRDLELLAASESVGLARSDSGVRLAFNLPSENQGLSGDPVAAC
ncbi:hypothetical protein [Polaromonas sp. CG_9.11]|uniref:hypothetical protein n=1 Tax=Polaromonas sp. CG_9.11 TaxID=2787730 RepID=UPI0018CA96E3|nr:hypothetical protein [Polaromonas sp. CG_9.11]MBG6077309.1 hypothetical protein [Polaromonas sp. CG_9.11]